MFKVYYVYNVQIVIGYIIFFKKNVYNTRKNFLLNFTIREWAFNFLFLIFSF